MADIGHNSADAKLRSYIDRILRCREAEDAAKEDTKAVYAELKAEGYDKSAAGALVAELRKKDKNPDKFNEANAVLDLYRDAYHRATGTVLATHVHAPDPKLVETIVKGVQTDIGRNALTAALDVMIEREESQAKASEDNGRISGGAAPVTGEVSRRDASRKASATSEIMDVTAGETAQDFQPPAFLVKERVPLRPNCLDPENCAGYGTHTCHRCATAAARPVDGAAA